MNLNESFTYDEIFAGWTDKELRTANNLIKFLRSKEIELERFEDYVDFVAERNRLGGEVSKKAFLLRVKIWQDEAFKCSQCNLPMNLFPVNTSKCTMIPDKKILSTWMCQDEKGCGYQIYNHKPADWYWSKVNKKLKQQYGKMSIGELIGIEINEDSIQGFSYKNRGCGGKKHG